MLTANWLGNVALAERETAAVAQLTATREEIAGYSRSHTEAPAENGSLLDRVGSFLSEQTSALDVGARLEALGERAEAAVTHIVTLCVVFLLQYLALPVGAFWLTLLAVKGAWRLWWRPEP